MVRLGAGPEPRPGWAAGELPRRARAAPPRLLPRSDRGRDGRGRLCRADPVDARCGHLQVPLRVPVRPAHALRRRRAGRCGALRRRSGGCLPGAPGRARHRHGRGLDGLQAAAGVGPALALLVPAGSHGAGADAHRADAVWGRRDPARPRATRAWPRRRRALRLRRRAGRVRLRAAFRPQTRMGQRGGLPSRLLRRADRIGGADHGAGVSLANDTGDGPHGPLDLLITNATAVLGGVRDEQYRVQPGTALGVANRRIVWIGASADAQPARAARTIDAAGMLLLPGLINTHNHLFQNLVKGMGDEMYLLPWVETLILPTVDEMTPEECYLGALLGCLEAIRSGTTALMDFMFGIPNIEVHRAVMRAMRDSGIRGFFGRATRDLNPDSGWRDPWYLPLDEVFDQMRALEREFPSGLPVPSVLPAPGTMRTMTVGGLIRVKEYALSEGCQITIHMGEHTEERETSIDRWGIGAFQKGEEIGFLGPQVVAAHCVKLDRDDLEVIARTGTQVSYNPVSNMYLGNGFAPVLDMFELGIDVSLASDGGACGNTEDMLEVLKYGVLQPKAVAQDPRVFNARDVLRVATAGGAKALGLSADLGALDVGRLADMFLFDPYRLKTVPMHDPISTLVYAGSQSNVHTVIVDGNVVLDAGRFPNIDEDAFVREVQERALALAERVGTFRLMRGRRFTPFHYDRVGTEVGGGTARAGEDGAADPRPISADGFGGPPSGPPDTEPQRLV